MRYFYTFSCAFLFVSSTLALQKLAKARFHLLCVLFVLARGSTENIGLEPDLKQEKIALKTDDYVLSREERAMSDDSFTIAEKKLLEGRQQNYEYQAEINRLMSLIVNSLYSNREIFLREVISNASDALDKLRYIALTDKSYLDKTILKEEDTPKLEIRIKIEPEKKLIHVRDTGIGMTKEDLINNLGRIAKSGTKEWIEQLSKGDNLNQIGQFGVGFYSTFLIADYVTVTTKHAHDKQYIWESNGESTTSFTITEDPRGNTLGRGTLVTMHVKEDAEEFLEEDKIKQLIDKYSEFINFPILLWKKKIDIKEVPVEDETDEQSEIEPIEDDEATEGEKRKTKTVEEVFYEWEVINQTRPIWTRKPSDVKQEDYTRFYQSISKDLSEPLAHIHFRAEGDVDFTALLYIPGEPPFGMFDSRIQNNSRVKLYVRRVFITDKFEELLPKYLSFITGIVDSDDLPLNVSREMLQQHKTLQVIKKKLVRKAIAMFQQLEEDDAKFKQFLENYGTNLKLGVIEDLNNRTRLSKLLRFNTFKHPDNPIGLEQYVKEMKEGQEEIYYLGGETKEALMSSPYLEKLKKKGYDVLLLTEPIDEYVVTTLVKFDNKYKFVDVSKEGLKLDDDDQDRIKQQTEEFKPLLNFLKDTLKPRNIEKVTVTTRLSKSPCALVTQTYGHSANMERIIRAQALGDKRYKSIGSSRKILEINTEHPIIKELLVLVQTEQTDKAKRVSELLYETAVIELGFSLDDPSKFADRIHEMLADSLDISTETLQSFLESNADSSEEPKGNNKDEL